MDVVKTIDAKKLGAQLKSLAHHIAEKHRGQARSVALVGIANGGIPFAQMLRAALTQAWGASPPCGAINAAFHRDDIALHPIPKVYQQTQLTFDIEDRLIILCDDVLFTGRTARAALNELFDQGRPAAVELAVLFDRGHRKLPIQPDHVGFREDVDPRLRVKVNLPVDQPAEHSIVFYQP